MFERFGIKGMMEKTKKLKKPSWWHHPLIAYPLLIFVPCFGLFLLYYLGKLIYIFLNVFGIIDFSYFQN